MLLGEQPFDTIKDVTNVRAVRTNHRDTNLRTAMLIMIAYFSDGDFGAPTEIRHERPNHTTLRFEGMHITEQNIEFNPTNPHRSDSLTHRSACEGL